MISTPNRSTISLRGADRIRTGVRRHSDRTSTQSVAWRGRRGYVYFLQAFGCDESAIKIGFSDYPEGRARRIQSRIKAPLRLLAMFEADWVEERELHERFADARVLGEWFRPVPELRELIESLAA